MMCFFCQEKENAPHVNNGRKLSCGLWREVFDEKLPTLSVSPCYSCFYCGDENTPKVLTEHSLDSCAWQRPTIASQAFLAVCHQEDIAQL